MKEETIKIRLSKKLKEKFEEICIKGNNTMSLKIHDFIEKEVNQYSLNKISNDFYMFLGSNGFDNIKIIDSASELIVTESGPKRYYTGTYNHNFITFINENKDKCIYLYLMGSDIPNNKFRAFVI